MGLWSLVQEGFGYSFAKAGSFFIFYLSDRLRTVYSPASDLDMVRWDSPCQTFLSPQWIVSKRTEQRRTEFLLISRNSKAIYLNTRGWKQICDISGLEISRSRRRVFDGPTECYRLPHVFAFQPPHSKNQILDFFLQMLSRSCIQIL